MNRLLSAIRNQLSRIALTRSKPSKETKREGALEVSSVRKIVLMAAWFGLVTGMVEGVGLWVLQQQGRLRGSFIFLGLGPESVWVSTLFNVLLFLALGFVLGLGAAFLPRLPVVRLSVLVFAFLMFFDWLAMLFIGRISLLPILVLAFGLALEASRWFVKHGEAFARLFRKTLPWLGALAVLVLVGIQGASWLREKIAVAQLPKATSGAPNVLVIVIDTLRADHLSSYGYARPTSPNIDRLAEQGVLFENAFATSSWTQPSHASLVTGRYTYEHDAELKPLDDYYPTIAEAFQARGYRTGAFSANKRVFNRRNGFDRGFVHFEDYYRTIRDLVTSTVYGRLFEYYGLHRALGFGGELGRILATDINRNLLRWIDRDNSKPFFAFLNYYDPHAPYVPPQPYRSMFSEVKDPGGLINTSWGMEHIYLPMTPEQLQGEIDAYDGAVAYVDDQIGWLLAELERRNLVENTLVVITSDHGELFGEHDLLEHQNSLYREVIHVPLIFWWLGHAPEGVRVAQPVTNAALPATLLDLLGEGTQSLFPGPSLAQLWKTPLRNLDWPDPLAEIAQIPWVPSQHLTAHGAMKSVISPQWHYIEHREFGPELYEWKTDPQELHNVVENPDFQAIVQEFKALLERLWTGAARLAQ